jgi:hypothetical protein
MTSRYFFLLPFAVVMSCVPGVALQAPFASACAEDDRIEKPKKDALGAASLEFIRKLIGDDPSLAYPMLSSAAKANVTAEQMSSHAAAIRISQPNDLALKHTYLLHLTGKSPGRLVCAEDFSKRGHWVSLGAIDVPEQAHVELSARTKNNEVAFTLWLVPEEEHWKVQSYWMNIATLADKDSTALWELGRVQHANGHEFNAALLFSAASQIANRGPHFQLGITQPIAEDLSDVKTPTEIAGAPPFTWTEKQTTFKILNVGPIAVGGKIYIIIAHEVSPWKDENEVAGWNKQLLVHFKNRFPEYSEVFAGLVARAFERGTNRGYGTVEELDAAKK